MRRLAPIALVLLAAPSLARAEAGECEADLRALAASPPAASAAPGAAEALARLRPAFEDGRCVLRDLAFQLPVHMSPIRQLVEIEEIAWRAAWAEDGERALPPAELSLAVRGLSMIYESEGMDPAIAYTLRLTAEAAGADAFLDYRLDPQTHALDITRLEMVTGDNAVALAATVEGFEAAAILAPEPRLDKLLRLRLRALDLRLRNDMFFQAMSGAWLEFVYPRLGETPEDAVANAQMLVLGQIETIPDDLVTQETRAALAAAVAAVPHPVGELRLGLSGGNGLAAQDLAPLFMAGTPSWEMLRQPLADLRLSAEWEPAARR